ncbi:MAG: replication protein [Clostridia bacterium]|nr:replication protein [Clostridia bacterium]
MSNMSGQGRTRNYATVVYEESAPKNWRNILSDCLVPAFISPYHKDDINADGTPKKPHWHILIMFDGVKSPEQAKEIFAKIGGVGCEKVNVLRGYARYLCHLDNPDKAQYDISEVTALCGADYQDIISLASDKYKVIEEMIDFCEKYQVYSFYLLSKYAFKNRDTWKKALADNSAIFMREYLQSKRWSEEYKQKNIIDIDTGEILI